MSKPRPSRRIPQDVIIGQFQLTHGDKYDYSKVEYTGVDNDIIITCPMHGDFKQTPYSHRKGSKCSKCAGRGLTNEDWVARFHEVHGDRFDYSKVMYKDNLTKITIICEEHGEFKQNPHSHRAGNGCPKCAGLGMTTEVWIERAISIHGDTYNYSKTEYVNSTTKLMIICPTHGGFEMLHGNHTHATRPQDCGKCSGKNLSTEDWIKRSKNKYSAKFDYSRTVYNSSHESITLICDAHGEFTTTPTYHMRLTSSGCPQCSTELVGLSQRKTHNDVISEFKEMHGELYDYSKIVYKSANEPMTIICREHGEFQQRLHAHLGSATGCPDCSLIESGLKRRLTKEQVIERAIQVHGDKYDYSKVEYETIEDQITIICSKHGDFLQVASVHVNTGSGCPECGWIESGMKKRVSTVEWLERFAQIHKQRYDYSLSDIQTGEGKISIICPEHGIFEQGVKVHGRGSGCSKCLKKNQTKVYEFVKEIFPHLDVLYDYKHPDMRFKKSNRKMELDIWVPNISLGIEYQGEQHYEEFWQGNVELNEHQTQHASIIRDEEKRIACFTNGIPLIEIPYTWNATIDYVKDVLSLHGIVFEMV
ncbi:MAG: DUF723 domain-containing protein [archaeon]|nr:DUF723 domain-containing protein [archaeon]